VKHFLSFWTSQKSMESQIPNHSTKSARTASSEQMRNQYTPISAMEHMAILPLSWQPHNMDLSLTCNLCAQYTQEHYLFLQQQQQHNHRFSVNIIRIFNLSYPHWIGSLALPQVTVRAKYFAKCHKAFWHKHPNNPRIKERHQSDTKPPYYIPVVHVMMHNA